MDLAALAEDEGGHLRIPVTGLMTKMHASLKHLAHGDICHWVLSSFGLGFHVPHDGNPEPMSAGSGHPAACADTCVNSS